MRHRIITDRNRIEQVQVICGKIFDPRQKAENKIAKNRATKNKKIENGEKLPVSIL
jgi:hypothetical protein